MAAASAAAAAAISSPALLHHQLCVRYGKSSLSRSLCVCSTFQGLHTHTQKAAKLFKRQKPPEQTGKRCLCVCVLNRANSHLAAESRPMFHWILSLSLICFSPPSNQIVSLTCRQKARLFPLSLCVCLESTQAKERKRERETQRRLSYRSRSVSRLFSLLANVVCRVIN